MNYAIKRTIEAIFKCIFKIVMPATLIITSILFINEAGTVDSNADQDIIYTLIKYTLLFLDFIAALIILSTLKDLLYDLGILREKEHKIKIKN